MQFLNSVAVFSKLHSSNTKYHNAASAHMENAGANSLWVLLFNS